MSSMLRIDLSSLTLRAMPMILVALLIGEPAFSQELAPGAKSSERSRERKLSPEREELRERFEARLERIDALKDRGVIGEAFTGSIEPLDARLLSRSEATLIAEENRDRQSLYAMVADDRAAEKKKVTPRAIAERNAARKFAEAGADQFLFIDEGRWIHRRDQPRAERIARWKREGVVGETWEGWLDAVGRDISLEVEALIKEENRARRAMYDEIAGRIDKVSAGEIAREAAKSIRERLEPGTWFKPKDGAWEKSAGRS